MGRCRLIAKDVFRYGSEVLDIVNSFKHFGVKFSKLGNFAKCSKISCDKASKVMFSLLQTARKIDLQIHVTLNLFGKMVVPVLLYGCEACGYQNLDLVNKFQMKF